MQIDYKKYYLNLLQMQDVLPYILSLVDYEQTKQKELTLVCKNWKSLLSSPNFKNNFDKPHLLSIDTLENNKGKINWEQILHDCNLSESFIERFEQKLNWPHVSAFQTLSEVFIEKHHNKIDWYVISFHQKLSEPFIEKHIEKLNLNSIILRQDVSPSFIKKNQDKIRWEILSCFSLVESRPEIIDKYKDILDFKYLAVLNQCSRKYNVNHRHYFKEDSEYYS